MSKFNGKNVVITGGTSGIGFATARAFLEQGARVLVTGRNAKSLEVARQELGAAAHVVASDAGDLAASAQLAKDVEAHFGKVDHLFVNAGVAEFRPIHLVDEAFWDRQFDTNLKGAFFTVQKLAPLLREGGSVILNTSVVDEKGMPGTSVYAASKAGLRSLARTLSAELLAQGVRVNAVSPGPITTPIYDKLGLDAASRAGFEEQMTTVNPMKRFGRPDEVAKAVLFLAGDATYTTGLELTVDGGFGQL